MFHEAAIRITQCAEEPAIRPARSWSTEPSRCSRRPRSTRLTRSGGIVGVGVRASPEEFPTTERHHHHNNDTFYGAAKSFNEGMLRKLPRQNVRPGLHRVAAIQCLRPPDGYPRSVHRGPDRWMERIADGKTPLIFGDGSKQWDLSIPLISPALTCSPLPRISERASTTSPAEPRRAWRISPRVCLPRWKLDLELEHGPERAVNGVTRRLASTEPLPMTWDSGPQPPGNRFGPGRCGAPRQIEKHAQVELRRFRWSKARSRIEPTSGSGRRKTAAVTEAISWVACSAPGRLLVFEEVFAKHHSGVCGSRRLQPDEWHGPRAAGGRSQGRRQHN